MRTQNQGDILKVCKIVRFFVSELVPGSEKMFKRFAKGIVSRELWLVLLHINGKLFLRAGDAHHEILILLMGHFAIYKKIVQSI